MTAKAKAKALPVMPRLVADDNGYADHKIAWFDEKEKIMTGKVSSVIQLGGQGFSSAQGERVGAYTAGGVEFTCSLAVTDPLSLRTADYPTSVANRVLFNHALTRFGMLGMPVEAAVTLPFRDFYKEDGTINTALRALSAENFMTRDVSVIGSEAQPNVQGVKVYAEALSAWFDWAIMENGELSDGYNEMTQMQGEMLVVDIGGSTTDLACLQIIEGVMLINHAKSGTEKLGVLDAKHKLSELVRVHMSENGVDGMSGHDSRIPQQLINVILETGKGMWAGKTWDFTEQRDNSCHEVAERIRNYIKSKSGNSAGFFSILVVGGGAIVFKKMLEKVLPNAIFSDEYANARGALKFLRDQRKQSAGA